MKRAILKLNDKQWKDARKKYVTATEVAAIFKLNKYLSIKKLVEGKNGPHENISSAYITVGHLLERAVVEATNLILESDFDIIETKGYKDLYVVEDVRLAATPDAKGSHGLLECKTTKPENYVRWRRNPPLHYLMQLCVQMICAGQTEGHIAIMSTNLSPKDAGSQLPIHIFKVQLPGCFERIICDEVARFWQCFEDKKQFRVDQDLAALVKLNLQLSYEKLF